MKTVKDERHHLTAKQLLFILYSSMVGVGILSLPRTASADAGQDAWIAVILGGIYPLLGLIFTWLLCRRFPSLALVEYSDLILGKYLGKVCSLIYIVYLILLAAAITSGFGAVLRNFVLTETPNLVVVLIMVAVCGNLARYGAKVLGRVNEFLFYLSIPLCFLIFTGLGQSSLLNFQPVGQAGVANICKGAYASSFAYTGLEVLLTIHPFVQGRQKVLKTGLLSVGLVVVTYTFVVVLTLAYFGVEATQHGVWPVFRLTKAVTVPVVERLDLFFIILWVFVICRTIANPYFAASYSLAKMLHLREHKYVTLALAPVLVFIATRPQDVNQVFKFADFVGVLGLITGLGVPLFLLVAAVCRGKKEGGRRAQV